MKFRVSLSGWLVIVSLAGIVDAVAAEPNDSAELECVRGRQMEHHGGVCTALERSLAADVAFWIGEYDALRVGTSTAGSGESERDSVLLNPLPLIDFGPWGGWVAGGVIGIVIGIGLAIAIVPAVHNTSNGLCVGVAHPPPGAALP